LKPASQRDHFLFLDGLRGIAAISVMLWHWFHGQGMHLFGSSILAVDFFFMLSGFVVSYAYTQRLESGYPTRRFFLSRIIRLYPLILAGIGLGLIRASSAQIIGIREVPVHTLMQWLVLNLAMIPFSLRSIGAFFPLDIPLWSLHFELLAYLAFGLGLYRLRSRTLAALVIVAVIGQIAWAISVLGAHADGTSFLPLENHRYFYGLARVTASFTLGMLVFRFRHALASRIRFPGALAIVILIALSAAPRSSMPPAVAMAALLLAFPAIIAGGTNIRLAGRSAMLARFLGDLSYPLYVLHVPLMWMMSGSAKMLHLTLGGSQAANGLVILPTVIAICYLVFQMWDVPVRRWLTKRFVSGVPRSREQGERGSVQNPVS